MLFPPEGGCHQARGGGALVTAKQVGTYIFYISYHRPWSEPFDKHHSSVSQEQHSFWVHSSSPDNAPWEFLS